MYLLLQSENIVQTGRGKGSVKPFSAEEFKIVHIFLGKNPLSSGKSGVLDVVSSVRAKKNNLANT